MWKCHTCGYKFNFQKLAFERFLSSRYSSGVLTMLAMVVIMFFLGFIADPIINMYVDPYQSLLGDQDVWSEVTMKVKTPGPSFLSSWAQHFTKGLVSMGLMGFLKTLLLNPLNWLNLRHNLGMTSARTTTTGRDRAINISWVAVLIGMVSAFYFFYQWMQTVIQMSLKRVGNSVVDTAMPGDDDDLKPPAGWKRSSEKTGGSNESETHVTTDAADAHFDAAGEFAPKAGDDPPWSGIESHSDDEASKTRPGNSLESSPVLVGSLPSAPDDVGHSSAIDSVHDQSWSFASI